MPGEVAIGAPALLGFLLCLSRVSGLVLFVPIPGMRTGPDTARIVLAVALSLVLEPFWPTGLAATSAIELAAMVLAEASIGLGAGLAIALLLEGFQMAGQILGLQAGFSYASTIDPSSQADTGLLQVWIQLATGFLFFAAGLDHAVVRAIAAGLNHPATWRSESTVAAAAKLGSAMFSLAVRLAFPVVALVLLLDIALALTGRMQAQLQLLSLAFPVKILAAILLLSVLTAAFPTVFEKAAQFTFRTLPALGQ